LLIWFLVYGEGRSGSVGRIHGQESDTGGNLPYFGYIDTESWQWVRLMNPGYIMGTPMMQAEDTTLWYRDSNNATPTTTIKQISSTTGAVLNTINLPVSALWQIQQDRTGMLWFWVPGSNTTPTYVYHPTTLTLVSTLGAFGADSSYFLGFTEDDQAVITATDGTSHYFKIVDRLGRVTPAEDTLSGIVTDICERVGLSAADIDVSELTDSVKGYAVTRTGSARAALAPLQTAFRFDVVESDNIVSFRKRGRASVATLTEDDIGVSANNSIVPRLNVIRALETENPREVQVKYIDLASNYMEGSQYARRLAVNSKEKKVIELPIVLSEAQAAAVAEYELYNAWANRSTVELNVSRAHCRLEPTDVFDVTNNGLDRKLRTLDKKEKGGVITLLTVTEDVNVSDTVSAGVALPTGSDTVGASGPTIFYLLDIPLLLDADNGAGIYALATGVFTGWSGAALWVSYDNGATYQATAVNFMTEAVVGTATNALGTFVGNTIDEGNSVTVSVNGELSSTTLDLMLAGANACYLGGELLHFRDAELVSAGVYRLTGLLRARKGTVQYLSTHIIGEVFILLQSGSTKRVPLTNGDIGSSKIYKAPSFGQLVTEAAPQSIVPAGVGLKPLAPVHLGGGRTAAASYDINITWVRCARIDTTWRDYVDVPLDEATEDYVVEIYSSSAYTTLKRTITTTASANGSVVTAASRTAVYDSADQVTDFGSNQSTIYVKVYQLSAVVGRGFALTGSI
jgi:hypothetical protein